jgi:TRAP-type C4-dicarboxylate transport system substrate-binding protein
MKKRMVVLCTVFPLVFALFVLAPGHAQEKAIKLKYTTYFPPVHAVSKLQEEWCKEVEKRTGGRVKISYFPGSTLTPPMQTYDSVVKGIADIGQGSVAYAPGRLPLSELLEQPLGYTNGYQSTKLANEYYKKFRAKEFDDVKVMYLHGPAPGIFHVRKVVSSIDDIKGLRIKANAGNAPIVKQLGGAPVTQPISETYDSIQKGLLDGVLLPIEALKGWRFAEVLKNSIENYAVSYMSAMYVIMNKDKWNSLSGVDQQAIEKIDEEWIEKQGKLWNQLDEEAKEFAIQKGVKFIRASKQEEEKTAEKMKPILTAYVEKMKEKGLQAEAAAAVEFCLNYIKTHP